MRTTSTPRVKSSMKLAFLLLAAGCGLGVSSQPHKISNEGTPGTCADPEGPLHPYTKAADVDAMFVGKWVHCSGPTFLMNGDEAFEFTADGTYYVLQDNGTNLVRKTGFGNQGTWDTYQETEKSVQLSYHPTPNSGNGGAPQFEDDPRRVAIELFERDVSSIYVWTGE